MNEEVNFKEVDYATYCPKCKNFNRKNEDPELTENEMCHLCLNEPVRQFTKKPMKFEER